MKASIYGLTIEELKGFFEKHHEKGFRAKQVFDWLYKKRVSSFLEMKNLPKNVIDLLNDNFDIDILTLDMKQRSVDETEKFLFQVRDGHFLETVFMKHNYGYSVCVSTQVGCMRGCNFCASTIGGLIRNLESGEIMAQVIEVQKYLDKVQKRVSSIVLMGTGEPFDNYDNVMKFIDIVNGENSLNIGARHITVSTCGVVPKIYEFADLNSQVTLAISLHATNNTIRSMIMPVNRKYPLESLIDAVKYYNEKTKRRVTFEFGLLDGINDSVEEANRLAKLVKPLLCHVNVIPINYVKERNYLKPNQNRIMNFVKTLEKAGINVTIRREKGADIDAACGQLRAKKGKMLEEDVCLKD